MKIIKFGGSSLADATRIRTAAEIITTAAKSDRIVVIVSAMQGVTNQLLSAAQLASVGNTSYSEVYAELADRHFKALRELYGEKGNTLLHQQLSDLFSELYDLLHGIYLLRDYPASALDTVASFGERFSALIISNYVNEYYPAYFVDARELIITDAQFTNARVLFDQTNIAIQHYFKQAEKEHKKSIAVVTGFIASTEDGRTTTIGRNGSDYSAAIIGAALNAKLIEIWTDVDGVYSADPRIVPEAFVLAQLSYEEAMELAYFGAKVLHPATIIPAITKKIPLLIKNTLNPAAPGTLITESTGQWDGIAKGISAIDNATLITVHGTHMLGVPGTAERLFKILAQHQVNIILISQASSEHTLCLAISETQAKLARRVIEEEFYYEIENHVTSIDQKDNQTIVAIVSDRMPGSPGVSGKMFQALGMHNINVNAIAQGASERNISIVVNSSESTRTLNLIHQTFFEKTKRLYLCVIGVGNIGSALLQQLQQQRAYLINQGYDIRICAVANSKKMLINPNGIDLDTWQKALDTSTLAFHPHELAQKITQLALINVALVDCTASADIVNIYQDCVRAGMHIVTPNKKANVLPWHDYQAFMDLLKKRQKYFLFEANVGAGLPVISTLKDLIAGGDKIIKIEGILSGTLSYLFNNFDGSQPFSKLVHEAHNHGYTEPDPREDLSGMDVGRKLLILARQLGWQMELSDIKVENLVPKALQDQPYTETFYSQLTQVDKKLHQRAEDARKRNMVLRYAGVLSKESTRASLQEVPLSNPLAATRSSDNIIAFTTQRYCQTPLIIQGPGAGAAVTAMGVFSDILKLLHYLPY